MHDASWIDGSKFRESAMGIIGAHDDAYTMPDSFLSLNRLAYSQCIFARYVPPSYSRRYIFFFDELLNFGKEECWRMLGRDRFRVES